MTPASADATMPSPRRGIRAWFAARPLVFDGLLAGGVWFVSVVLAAAGGSSSWVGFLLGSLQTLPLILRRVRPITAFVVVSAACAVSAFVTTHTQPADIGFLFALYAASAFIDREYVRRLALAVAVIGSWFGSMRTGGTPPGAWAVAFGAMFVALVCLVVWLWGGSVRARRLRLAGLEAQNAALRRERDQRALLAAQEERTRIAREMHDVVAHSLAVVVVQADGAAYAARHGAAWEREQAAQALETIAATAREALADTRRLVGVLREDRSRGAGSAGFSGGASRERGDGPGTTGSDALTASGIGASAGSASGGGDRPSSGEDAAQGEDTAYAMDYAPTATLADISGLVERLRGSGQPITLTLEAPGSVPRDVGLAAYRIVQEALTNVLKHAGPHAMTTVTIRPEGGTLVVEIADDGRGVGARDDGEGHGLIGMRERVSAVGGTLVTGPRPSGGFGVLAHLPLG